MNRPLASMRWILPLLLVAVSAVAQQAPPVPGQARYVIVLKAGADLPDLAPFGGTVEGKTWWCATVVIPSSAVSSLVALPGVESISPVVDGTSARRPEKPLPRASNDLTRASQAPSQLWTSGTYAYDGAGNITAIGSDAFTYDASSRLTAASVGSAAGTRTETYDYDVFGNLLERKITSDSPNTVINPLPDVLTNRMTETGVAYDPAGNVTSLPVGITMSYDASGQMTSKSISGSRQRYIYTATDERIGIDDGNSAHWTIRDFDNKPLRQYESVSLSNTNWSSNSWAWKEDFVWSDTRLLAAQTSAGLHHFHPDHLGSSRVVTDANASPTRHDYAPFGEEITASTSDQEPLRFTSHERDYNVPNTSDTDNAFDYMHARYYEGGRFLSVDPSVDLEKAVHEPQLFNRYAYVTNNPIRYVDADGRERLPCASYPHCAPVQWRGALTEVGEQLTIASMLGMPMPGEGLLGRFFGAVGRFCGVVTRHHDGAQIRRSCNATRRRSCCSARRVCDGVPAGRHIGGQSRW
jgi:RHS repeat-associated protein